MAGALDFWFDFASTYSYPAAWRVGDAAKKAGVDVRWRPFLLGPVFAKQGWMDSPFNIYPTKGRYMWRDLERICSAEGLPLSRPTQFPRNGLTAARMVFWGAGASWVPDFVRGVYRANFGEDRDISDDGVLRDLLSAAGAPIEDAFTGARDDTVKAAFRKQVEEAETLGIFGSPTFVTPDRELFWGNDRLEDAVLWCTRKAA